MGTPMDYFIVTSILIVAYITIKLFNWFMSPYFIDKNDPKPRLKSYRFTDPTTTQSFKFPTINDKPEKSISLIFPAYNEEDRLRACLDPTIKYLEERENNNNDSKSSKSKQGSNGTSSKPFTWEIIVVSDGSKDKTGDIVQEYVAKHTTDKIRLLSYTKNQGKGFAVQQGMLHARGCLVLFADADGASEITHLSRLEDAILNELSADNHWECAEKDCIAIGSRAHLQAKAEAERTIFRNFLMWGFHFVVEYVGDVHGIKDTQCGFKLFTRNAVRKTVGYQRIRRWCFDPEQLMLAQKQGIPIKEKQIAWQEIDGSKIQPLKASFNMAREMVLMRACYIFGIWYKELKK